MSQPNRGGPPSPVPSAAGSNASMLQWGRTLVQHNHQRIPGPTGMRPRASSQASSVGSNAWPSEAVEADVPLWRQDANRSAAAAANKRTAAALGGQPSSGSGGGPMHRTSSNMSVGAVAAVPRPGSAVLSSVTGSGRSTPAAAELAVVAPPLNNNSFGAAASPAGADMSTTSSNAAQANVAYELARQQRHIKELQETMKRNEDEFMRREQELQKVLSSLSVASTEQAQAPPLPQPPSSSSSQPSGPIGSQATGNGPTAAAAAPSSGPLSPRPRSRTTIGPGAASPGGAGPNQGRAAFQPTGNGWPSLPARGDAAVVNSPQQSRPVSAHTTRTDSPIQPSIPPPAPLSPAEAQTQLQRLQQQYAELERDEVVCAAAVGQLVSALQTTQQKELERMGSVESAFEGLIPLLSLAVEVHHAVFRACEGFGKGMDGVALPDVDSLPSITIPAMPSAEDLKRLSLANSQRQPIQVGGALGAHAGGGAGGAFGSAVTSDFIIPMSAAMLAPLAAVESLEEQTHKYTEDVMAAVKSFAERLQEQIDVRTLTVDDAHQAVDRLTQERQALEFERDEAFTHLRTLQQRREQLMEQRGKEDVSKQESQRRLADMDKELQDLLAELMNLDRQMESSETATKRFDQERLLLVSDRTERDEATADARQQERSLYNSELSAISIQLSGLLEQEKESKNSLQQIRNQLEDKRQRLEMSQTLSSTLRNETEKQQQETRKIQRLCEESDQAYRMLERKVSALKTELDEVLRVDIRKKEDECEKLEEEDMKLEVMIQRSKDQAHHLESELEIVEAAVKMETDRRAVEEQRKREQESMLAMSPPSPTPGAPAGDTPGVERSNSQQSVGTAGAGASVRDVAGAKILGGLNYDDDGGGSGRPLGSRPMSRTSDPGSEAQAGMRPRAMTVDGSRPQSRPGSEAGKPPDTPTGAPGLPPGMPRPSRTGSMMTVNGANNNGAAAGAAPAAGAPSGSDMSDANRSGSIVAVADIPLPSVVRVRKWSHRGPSEESSRILPSEHARPSSLERDASMMSPASNVIISSGNGPHGRSHQTGGAADPMRVFVVSPERIPLTVTMHPRRRPAPEYVEKINDSTNSPRWLQQQQQQQQPPQANPRGPQPSAPSFQSFQQPPQQQQQQQPHQHQFDPQYQRLYDQQQQQPSFLPLGSQDQFDHFDDPRMNTPPTPQFQALDFPNPQQQVPPNGAPRARTPRQSMIGQRPPVDEPRMDSMEPPMQMSTLDQRRAAHRRASQLLQQPPPAFSQQQPPATQQQRPTQPPPTNGGAFDPPSGLLEPPDHGRDDFGDFASAVGPNGATSGGRAPAPANIQWPPPPSHRSTSAASLPSQQGGFPTPSPSAPYNPGAASSPAGWGSGDATAPFPRVGTVTDYPMTVGSRASSVYSAPTSVPPPDALDGTQRPSVAAPGGATLAGGGETMSAIQARLRDVLARKAARVN